jgi:Na+/H+-dicarboxylate symporter
LSQQAKIGQSRSSVLNPQQWMMVIMVAGLTSFVFARAPNWLIVLMAALLTSTFVLFAFGFIYFMVREPGTLRSEMYALLKAALDKVYFTADTVALLAGRESKIGRGEGFSVENVKDLKETVKRRRRSQQGEG